MLCRRENMSHDNTKQHRPPPPPSPPQRQATRMRPTYSIQQCLLCVKEKNFFYPPPLSPQLRRIIKVSLPSTKFSKRTFLLPPLPISPKKPSSSVRLLVPHKFCKNGGKEEKWGPFPSASRQVGWGEQKKKKLEQQRHASSSLLTQFSFYSAIFLFPG